MSDTCQNVSFRIYERRDCESVAELWTRINRELAPPDMRELFERYISVAVNGELRQLHDIFAEARRNAFWVVASDTRIIGTFGIESRSDDSTELRRMYLDREYRGQGIAQQMLSQAEQRARDLGFSRMILSTAQVQTAAIAFYRKTGYRLVKTEVADSMSTKTAGGGLRRFHFEKVL
jgi:GNAT superfamily N-acetyltransferase